MTNINLVADSSVARADLLWLDNGGLGLDATVRVVYTGLGQPSPLRLSLSEGEFHGAMSFYGSLTVAPGYKLIGELDCLANSSPEASDGSASAGTATTVSRSDHKHRAPASTDLTDAPMRSLIQAANAAASRAVLGLGTAALANTGTTEGAVLVLGPGGSLPAADGSALTGIVATPVVSVVEVGVNTTLDSTYSNKLIVCTAAVTLTLPAASGLATNWTTHIKPQGGAVTLQRVGSDTIDAATSIKVEPPGWGRQLRAFSIIRASSSTFWSF